jgi:hypothetical protein
MADSERRRSERVLVNIPVVASGDSASGTFTEETQTLIVNVQGALIPLAARVAHGQMLLLRNRKTSEEQSCRVVYVGLSSEEKRHFGITFNGRAPHFWGIPFSSGD